ncbi:ubiquitin carboxyl-terminal hydrolase 22/27/51 [Paragonimus westermani]|uniref:Ubiquitin carboxyl-terminal hydrolase n=1 Tax=Paragonimus westermani TaxID=34504 RepID=A0A5J4NVT3_9TREM|nr:ubiquitin carboxyl-terminal hydrolase 22/27/51 [Paragonimus westermani]
MTCKHADNFFIQKTNVIAYKTIVNYMTFPRSEKSFAHKASIACTFCTNSAESEKPKIDRSRPYCLLACAHCIHFSCWNKHHIDHHRQDHPEHVLYVCLERGELFCTACADFVYHPIAEQAHRVAQRLYLTQFGLCSQHWRPSFEELKLLPHITSVIPLSTKLGNRPTRGLINMGNTCFLNVVIQALTHTPVLRDYLLADLHRCNNPVRSRNCLACEMIRVTQEIYSPALTPFVPSNLLYAIWLHASHLAGYEQQDAHEFLITLLTLIHGHLVGEHIPLGDPAPDTGVPPKRRLTVSDRLSDNSASSSDSKPVESRKPMGHSRIPVNGANLSDEPGTHPATTGVKRPCPSESHPSDSASSQTSVSSSRDSGESCDCIVHQVFFGDLESVISYEVCGHSSSTVDPFLDLSLDVIQRGSTSLQACLTSYFRPESIDGLILCSQCNVGRPAVKQFSLLHLPNVLCFYLKRCHHDTKINTSITFPADLDLAPYLSHVDGGQSAWQDRYSLYAVVNHSGQTNSGHYTAYIRSAPGSWCLCDDQKIVSVSLEHVLRTDAYVLLYHKNLLAIRA